MRTAAALALALLASGCGDPTGRAADGTEPDAGLVAAGCRWERAAGGDLELRVQACDLATGRWRVRWHEHLRGFALQVDDRVQATVVQPWPLSPGTPPGSVVAALRSAGHLPVASACRLLRASVRPLPERLSTFVVAPPEPTPAMTAVGDIPEPPCGPYGASTHGVRYFVFDPQRPDRLVFIDEGQDQPMFDPVSIFAP